MPSIIRTSACGKRHASTWGRNFPRGPFHSVYKLDGVEVATAEHKTLREADAWTREVLGIDERPEADLEQREALSGATTIDRRFGWYRRGLKDALVYLADNAAGHEDRLRARAALGGVDYAKTSPADIDVAYEKGDA